MSSTSLWRYHLLAPTLVLLAGAAARIAPLTDNRFHPDEALYASYGRLISTYDWNLASRLVDKPPLLFYLMAGAFQRVGPNEVAARLPDLAASLLALALVWRLALALWGDRGLASLAMLFCALSPLAVLFGPTAFTDPLLVLWLLAALLAVSTGRWGWGGLFAGLALATKQTALFFFPLVIGLAFHKSVFHPDVEARNSTPAFGIGASPLLRSAAIWLARFCVPIVVVVSLLVVWDSTRGPVTGFWRAGVQNNQPGGLARVGELGPRLRAWLVWLSYLGGWSPANLLIVLTLCALLARHLSGRGRIHAARLELAILLFVLAYLVTYWVVDFSIYDRYLLALVPLFGLLVARGLVLVWPRRAALAGLALAGLMAWPAWEAAHSRYPVGGDHGAYDGIDRLAAYLDSLPRGTVIYDHWLGWSLDFYLFDSPAYTTYFSMPADLTAALRQQPEGQPAVLLLPAWADSRQVLSAVTGAGYEVQLVFQGANRFGQPTLRVLRLRPISEEKSLR